MTSQEKRRDDSSRRVQIDRRENISSMISNYANYSGVERRINPQRRAMSDRRAVAA